MHNSSNTDEFIAKAISKHGNTYDYSRVNYINNITKITIICSIHGQFQQRPSDHLSGKGCKLCANAHTAKMCTKSHETFISESKNIHGDKYNYSKTKYINAKTKVDIICDIHGIFTKLPHDHLNGSGCPICVNEKVSKDRLLSLDEYVKRAKSIHGDKYDYSLVEYKGKNRQIKIICKHHGIFKQSANNHLKGANCRLCANSHISNILSKTQEQFILECQILNPDYDYSQVEYKRDNVKVKIGCPIHGIFEQVASSHLQGRRCPKCNSSKGELKIIKWLTINNIEYLKEKRFPNCRHKYTLPFDFYIPSLNICIEYDGEQHFVPMRFKGKENEMKHKLSIIQHRDSIKTQYCIDNKINLLRIPYTEFNNIEKILEEYIINKA